MEDAAAPFQNANGYRLADEALQYFEWLGLIDNSDGVEFLLQPLAEMAAAIDLRANGVLEVKGRFTIPPHSGGNRIVRCRCRATTWLAGGDPSLSSEIY